MKKFVKFMFFCIGVIGVFAIVAGNGEKKNPATETSTTEPIEYTKYEIVDLLDELESNAMRAEKHTGEFIEFTGYLGTIDSDGKYFSVDPYPEDDERYWDYAFQDIQCDFTDDTQKDIVIDMNTGDEITIRAKVSEVGEIMGYYVDVCEIVK